MSLHRKPAILCSGTEVLSFAKSRQPVPLQVSPSVRRRSPLRRHLLMKPRSRHSPQQLACRKRSIRLPASMASITSTGALSTVTTFSGVPFFGRRMRSLGTPSIPSTSCPSARRLVAALHVRRPVGALHVRRLVAALHAHCRRLRIQTSNGRAHRRGAKVTTKGRRWTTIRQVRARPRLHRQAGKEGGRAGPVHRRIQRVPRPLQNDTVSSPSRIQILVVEKQRIRLHASPGERPPTSSTTSRMVSKPASGSTSTPLCRSPSPAGSTTRPRCICVSVSSAS